MSPLLGSILVVDDIDGIRRLIRGALAGLVETTHEAANGADALALAREHVPDLVFLDLALPGSIRRQPRRRPLKRARRDARGAQMPYALEPFGLAQVNIDDSGLSENGGVEAGAGKVGAVEAGAGDAGAGEVGAVEARTVEDGAVEARAVEDGVV